MSEKEKDNNEPLAATFGHHHFCAGKIAFTVEVKVDTVEMRLWKPERIKALFDGIAMVQRAMAGKALNP